MSAPPPIGAPPPADPASTKAAPSPAPATTPSSAASGTTTTKKKSTKKKAAGDGTKTKKPVKRKKPVKSAGSAASNAATLAAAKTAAADLAQSRALSAARRTDPLWYRIEDCLPPTPATAPPQLDHMMASPVSTVLPEQVQIVEAALAHNNMTRSDVTPQAMACLLEQARRYAQELLEDAQDYAAHAGGMFGAKASATTANNVTTTPTGMPDPSTRDYLLAAEMRPDHPQVVTAELPKLSLLAQQVNAIPLPSIPPQCYSGVLLPPAPHVLTARTFDVVSGAHVAQKMIQAAPAQTKAFGTSMMTTTSSGESSSKTTSKSSKSNKPGYGASRGTQIPIHLKKAESSSGGEPKSVAVKKES